MTNQNKNLNGFLTQLKNFVKRRLFIMPSWIPSRSWTGRILHAVKEVFLLSCLMLWALVSIPILVMTTLIASLSDMISTIVWKKESPSILNTSTRSRKEVYRKRLLISRSLALVLVSLCLCVTWLLLA